MRYEAVGGWVRVTESVCACVCMCVCAPVCVPVCACAAGWWWRALLKAWCAHARPHAHDAEVHGVGWPWW